MRTLKNGYDEGNGDLDITSMSLELQLQQPVLCQLKDDVKYYVYGLIT